jgi:hypothetical protein
LQSKHGLGFLAVGRLVAAGDGFKIKFSYRKMEKNIHKN